VEHRSNLSNQSSGCDPEALGLGLEALGLALNEQHSAALLAFCRLLSERAAEFGVVSKGDADRMLERHILDSLRAVRALRPEDRRVYDLGSGAGLPGIPVAVARPDLEVRLVETRLRRVGWLELAVEEIGVQNATVVRSRVEELRETADVCIARAFAPIERSWELARPLLRPGGRLVYFAGRGETAERLKAVSEDVTLLSEPVLESGGPLVIIGAK
jgi:16S rRNA (guanine527-N7)-methyltransferase